ncbi:MULTISPECIES: LURP-one-related/scramblase family protein [unclassified Isoptericola]|uniref:LURP-one-related/scramblase family protein n=1 Tax=unclassified Isoptericola TaxID=2623355 RepID=UPI0036635F1E
MALPPPPAGWTRYVVKAKVVSVGRDFRVTDLDGADAFLVDGKLGPRERADVLDAAGTVVYRVTGRVINLPKRMTITDAAGTVLAELHGKLFSPIRSKMTLHRPDGPPWELQGNVIEKEYTVTAGGAPVMVITQKWVTVRDTYTLDVADGTDPGLAIAMLWAVDRWVERDPG